MIVEYNVITNVISIQLSDEESDTFDYMNALSSTLFQEHIENLFKNRKTQQEEDLKRELTKNMDRAQLKTELGKRNG